MDYTRLCFLGYMLLAWVSIPASAAGYGDHDGTKNTLEKPTLEKAEKLVSTGIGAQGLIYCKSGFKLIPLEGAVTRITCEAVDEYGFETTPLSFLSSATDANGYFLATLSPWEVTGKGAVKQCRAYLELSPLANCSEPTDVNKGISGALLHFDRFLTRNKMKLYTVGPFLFV